MHERALTRRRLLAKIPLAGAVAVFPGAAVATEPDPIVALYARFLAAEKSELEMEDPGDFPISSALLRELLDSRAKTIAGVAALADLFWRQCGNPFVPGSEPYAEVAEFVEHRLALNIRDSLAALASLEGRENKFP